MTITSSGHPHRLLLVSEQSAANLYLQRLIKSMDLSLTLATGIAASETLVQQERFDLVLLRPGPVGLEPWIHLLQLLQQQPQPVPVLACCDPLQARSADQVPPAVMPRIMEAQPSPTELQNQIARLLHPTAMTGIRVTGAAPADELVQLHQFVREHSRDIIYQLNAAGEIVYINNRVESLLNIRPEELIGKHFGALMSEETKRQFPHVFNERRSLQRAGQTNEIHLRKRLQLNQDGSDTTLSIPFEIIAAGTYQYDSQGSRFTGTLGMARDITDRRQAESLMRFQAYHDLLTGLPNRSLFRDRLSLAISHCKRNGSKVAVMFVDLDRFKLINDSIGHNVGDQLIQAVARRISATLREGDTLSRFGGDEFTLLLPNLRTQEDAVIIARKILSELQQPFYIEEHELFVSGSIGIALYPDHGQALDTLIQRADIAMYHTKAHGKNNLHFFNERMDTAYTDRLHLEHDLRQCLVGRQLFLEYQPIYNLETRQVYALEAFLRWRHPQRGTLLPEQFLPVAEETGLIVDIGGWVVNQVCADLQDWANPVLRIAVNFSPRQVAHGDFENLLMSAAKAHNVSPHQLELEITEDLLMQDQAQLTAKLRRLNRLGFSIAVDDFGTGFSSLGCLHQLPLNTIKLHESFLRQISNQQRSGDACIVKAVHAMATSLNLNLVAEGVETPQQRDYLSQLGCTTMQGSLFQKPLTSDQARHILVAPMLSD